VLEHASATPRSSATAHAWLLCLIDLEGGPMSQGTHPYIIYVFSKTMLNWLYPCSDAFDKQWGHSEHV
jgi:hypothetical protein